MAARLHPRDQRSCGVGCNAWLGRAVPARSPRGSTTSLLQQAPNREHEERRAPEIVSGTKVGVRL